MQEEEGRFEQISIDFTNLAEKSFVELLYFHHEMPLEFKSESELHDAAT